MNRRVFRFSSDGTLLDSVRPSLSSDSIEDNHSIDFIHLVIPLDKISPLVKNKMEVNVLNQLHEDAELLTKLIKQLTEELQLGEVGRVNYLSITSNQE